MCILLGFIYYNKNLTINRKVQTRSYFNHYQTSQGKRALVSWPYRSKSAQHNCDRTGYLGEKNWIPIQNQGFWDVAPCCFVNRFRRKGGVYCIPLQSQALQSVDSKVAHQKLMNYYRSTYSCTAKRLKIAWLWCKRHYAIPIRRYLPGDMA